MLTVVVELNEEQFVKNVLAAVRKFKQKLPPPEATEVVAEPALA